MGTQISSSLQTHTVAELDFEFQTNEEGHFFATVMNSSHFTIHVVGIFIGQGGPKPPLAPMKLRPCFYTGTSVNLTKPVAKAAQVHWKLMTIFSYPVLGRKRSGVGWVSVSWGACSELLGCWDANSSFLIQFRWM